MMEKDLVWNEEKEYFETEVGEQVQLIDEFNYKF